MTRLFSIIVAIDKAGGIGKNNNLPWHLPEDLKHFKTLTSNTNSPTKRNAVIMGRKTWESLPDTFKPLPNRYNIVLSQNTHLSLPADVKHCHSLSDALSETTCPTQAIENLFVIGGGTVYKNALQHPQCQHVHITKIDAYFDCDTFFPEYAKLTLSHSSPKQKKGPLSYQFLTYKLALNANNA